jgi:hypothetical protein
MPNKVMRASLLINTPIVPFINAPNSNQYNNKYENVQIIYLQ